MKDSDKIQQIIKVPLYTFGISFALGTVLMLLYLIDEDDSLLIIGFLYVMAAFVINLVVLLVMVALSYIHREYQKPILLNTAILFLNIPIAAVYMFILFN